MSDSELVVRAMRALRPVRHGILGTSAGRAAFAMLRPGKPRFECPLCGYHGPFSDIYPDKGVRRHAECPQCRSLERHRLHYLAFRELAKQHDFSRMSILHVAPDKSFRALFAQWFAVQHTADLNKPDVDFKVDLVDLPFDDASYDVVFASHVLEHIKDDRKALSEVRRVLRPGGIAVLPVPMVSPHTVEYPEPNRYDDWHWRAPGPDYFDRYREHFSSVQVRHADDFDARHQLYLYEDRSHFPTPQFDRRLPMVGARHPDLVPICLV